MIFRRFPYTTLNDINLDWIIKQVKQIAAALQGKQDKPDSAGVAGQILGLDENLDPVWLDQSGGGGGTTNYNNLTNKPQINGVTLSGNKTASDLGLAASSDIPAVPVQSVNGRTGAVVLDAAAVSALPTGTFIPTGSLQLPMMDGEASAGSSTARYALEGHVHPTDTSRASAADLATFAHLNLLQNWYFVGGGSQAGEGLLPINQQKQTIYGVNGHIIDRWKSTAAGIGIQLVQAGLAVTIPSTSADNAIVQNSDLTIVNAISGLTLTLSILFTDGTLGSTTFVAPTKAEVDEYTGWHVFGQTTLDNGCSIAYAISAPSVNLSQVVIRVPKDDVTRTIIAVKLEIGNKQTLAHYDGGWILNDTPDFALELYKCQRYYFRLAGEFQYIGQGLAFASSGHVRVLVQTPNMRSAPAVTLHGTLYLTNGSHADTGSISSSAVSGAFGAGPLVKINVGASGLTESEPFLCQFRDSSSYLEFDSRI